MKLVENPTKSRSVETLARAVYAAKGVPYGVVGVLAAQAAVGAGSRRAASTSAGWAATWWSRGSGPIPDRRAGSTGRSGRSANSHSAPCSSRSWPWGLYATGSTAPAKRGGA